MTNEGTVDRVVRILVGVALIGSAWLWSPSTLVSVIGFALGGIALVTGTVGWCPLYTACHVSTKATGHA